MKERLAVALFAFGVLLVGVQALAEGIGIPDSDRLGPYVFWFGPTGVAFALAAAVIGYFYRRDILQRSAASEAREQKMLDALIANATVLARVAEALERQSYTNERVEAAVQSFVQRMLRGDLRDP